MGKKKNYKILVDEDLFDKETLTGHLEVPLEGKKFVDVVTPFYKKFIGWKDISSLNQIDENDFVKSRVRNFFLKKSMPVDVYVRVLPKVFIIAIKKNRPIGQSLLCKYLKQGVKYFYFPKNERVQFLEEKIGQLGPELAKFNEVEAETMLAQAQAFSLIHEYIECVGVTEKIVNFSLLLLNSVDRLFTQSRGLKNILTIFPYLQKDIFEKGLITLYTSLALLEGMDWKSKSVKQKLGLASILHDIGMTNPKLWRFHGLYEMHEAKLSEAEISFFYQHIERPFNLLPITIPSLNVVFCCKSIMKCPMGRGYRVA